MTIKFILMVNKQGQTRLAQYYETLSIAEKSSLEGEIIRKCLARAEAQCSFLEYRTYKCVYRRYASLFFIVGVDAEENELAVLELIHNLVETLDKYFENVCELDVRLNNNHTGTGRLPPLLLVPRTALPRALWPGGPELTPIVLLARIVCLCFARHRPRFLRTDHVQSRACSFHPRRNDDERQDRRDE
jgi:AP-4 complex subunit sigma-1